MITGNELHWVAGFLEGEGSFTYHGTPSVTAAQVQKEPLDRIHGIFGGKMWQRTPSGFSTRPIWIWKASARSSIQIMMTLYTLMSPKRQEEIRRALDNWKSARLLKEPGSDKCAKGHDITGNNVIYRGKYKRCRACRNETRKKWRAKKSRMT